MREVESEERRSLPPGGTIETWHADDDWPLRVGVWRGGARGTLLLLNGRGDFLEKYCEAVWRWRARGWAVVAPDWRGQGGSGRWLWSSGGDGFARLIADLNMIAARAAMMEGQLVAVGHSMGGHLLLRAMAQETAPPISRAVLLAPMLGLRAATVARVLARGAVWLGLGARVAIGQGVRSAADDARRAALLTGDPARQTDEAWWLARHPELDGGGATWGWLDAALQSIAGLGVRGRITTADRVRAVLAGNDRVVDNRAGTTVLGRMIGPARILGVIAGAEHELLRETDPVRAALLARIDPFLEQA